jgi:hypothetical protein
LQGNSPLFCLIAVLRSLYKTTGRVVGQCYTHVAWENF